MKARLIIPAIVLGAASFALSTGALASTGLVTDTVTTSGKVVKGVGRTTAGLATGVGGTVIGGVGKLTTGVMGGVAHGTGRVLKGVGDTTSGWVSHRPMHKAHQ